MKIDDRINALGLGPFGARSVYQKILDQRLAAARFRGRLQTIDNPTQLTSAMRQIVRMRESLEKVKSLQMKSTRGGGASASPARAMSASALGLDATATPTTLKSTEELNTTPTSFSPYGPAWVGSTAQATIGGTYDGSNGTGTLKFEANSVGTHGVDDLQVKVYDPNDLQIDTIDIIRDDALGTQYTLSNGLTLTLSAGDLVMNDTFTVDVDDSVPTSFTPTGPAWKGSTAAAILGGVYDGSQGTSDLTFVADKTGKHGVDDLLIKVFDSNDVQIDLIDIKKADPIDTQYALSNGLTFTLGSGELLLGTSFTVNLYDATGSVADPTNPFNGTGNNNPILEPGFTITDGSFEINGETITVNASDSLNDVLDRITQSNAGVTATFDAPTETVVLTQKTAGSGNDIVLANDTSGFLAAMKLDGATATPGTDSEAQTVLSAVDEFSSVQSGNITINGTDIAIDINTDSLEDVLNSINSAGIGVTASLDQTGQFVTLSANSPSIQLTLEEGSTGFFAAIGISTGTYSATKGSRRHRGMSEPDIRKFTTSLRKVSSAMTNLFDDSKYGGKPGKLLEGVRSNIRNAVQASFDSEGPKFKTAFGIHFNFDHVKGEVFDFSRIHERRFKSVLSTREGVESIKNLFLGTSTAKKGRLIDRLISTLKTAEASLQNRIGSKGLFADITA